ncbi:hypothetical protein ACHAQJ_001370 [Trichoderma viride]
MAHFLPETFLERNKTYAETHTPAPTIAEQKALGLTFETTLVVTCVDFRLNPDQFLQIKPHDCGASQFKNEDIRAVHKSRLPDHSEIDGMVFGAFDDVEQSVRDDLQILKTSPYVPKKLADNSFGFVYDIKTGLLTSVE